MEKVLGATKKLIPGPLWIIIQPIYHYFLAFLGAIIYGFPSSKLIAIGVTGTKGKSTTVELINAIFEESGAKTALSNTIRFKIGTESTPNMYKMSMPGRFFMQKFLREAANAGCTYAIIEMTSEGAKLFRHKFIALNALVVTNIAPEHIEAHGSYEKYLAAKVSIALNLAHSSKERRILVVNDDDGEAPNFLRIKNVEKITYSLKDALPYQTAAFKNEFDWNGVHFISPLGGLFNLYNILGALTCAKAFGVSYEVMEQAIAKFKNVPGRLEKIEAGQDFEIYVDYAHTAESLEALYKTFPNQRKICVFGSTGGGRDKWKRPKMGEVADRYCEEIILTDDDSYDEDPSSIMEEIATGIKNKKLETIVDRRMAIKKALERAYTLRQAQGNKDVVVLITGKGTDPYLMGPNGKKTPWSDAKIVKEGITKLN